MTEQNAGITIRKAERRKAKLRLALAGPSGSGKTMSSLLLAKGLGGKVCMIDTERGSGDLYATLTDYDIITLKPPYKPAIYVAAIEAAEKAGYDIIIIDSLSHAWADEGGLLDQADRMQSSGRNRFTMWAELTPQHRQLVNAMLNSPKHIIATIRSKQGYAMETDPKTGKASVKKLGLEPVQRDGLEYEFTVFMDIDQNHNAHASKDRTNLFKNEIFVIGEKISERILNWLNEGKDDPEDIKRQIFELAQKLGISEDVEPEDFKKHIKAFTDLELEEKNYQEIANRLAVRLEQNGADTKTDANTGTKSETPAGA